MYTELYVEHHKIRKKMSSVTTCFFYYMISPFCFFLFPT